jgi:hypothetical protein
MASNHERSSFLNPYPASHAILVFLVGHAPHQYTVSNIGSISLLGFACAGWNRMMSVSMFLIVDGTNRGNIGLSKRLSLTSCHIQLLTGSEAAIFGLLMNFDADQQLSGNDCQKSCRFRAFQ